MSLEAAIERLTEVNERLIVVMEESNRGRAEVLEAAKSATAPKGKSAAEKKAEAEAAEKAKAGAAAPAAEAGDEVTLDDVKNAIAAYAGKYEDQAERDARKAYAGEILGKVGATKATEIPTDKYQVVLNTFKKLSADDKRLTTAPEPEAPAGDDDLLG